jgi:hypothetical protein
MDHTVITLKDLLDNPPRELDITGIGKIKVRDPKTEDFINAKEIAKKDLRWNDLTPPEKDRLVLDFLAISIIEEPKITVEDYYKSNSIKMSNIINAVVMDYSLRYKELTDKRSKEIRDFLERMKGSSLESSTTS